MVVITLGIVCPRHRKVVAENCGATFSKIGEKKVFIFRVERNLHRYADNDLPRIKC